MTDSAQTSAEQPPATLNFTRKIRLDRIGSVTAPAGLGPIVEVSEDCVAERGTVVVCRALGERKTYGDLELPSGRHAKIVHGNIVMGALGSRQALHGFMGETPKSLKKGDIISLLNIGGVMGTCISSSKAMGPPIEMEVIGCVIRNGKIVNIADYAIPPCHELKSDGPPLALVMGTCMNSGKTYAATEIIRLLSHSGVRVAAGKLSGVAALRDTLAMQDNGASEVSSFLECGLPSTVTVSDLAAVARSVIAKLEKCTPDLIVLELGDGVIGGYNLDSILGDPGIQARTHCRILCANDLVGAWGGVIYLEKFSHKPGICSGPVTDNDVGTSYISGQLNIPCFNARNTPKGLAQAVADQAGISVKVKDY